MEATKFNKQLQRHTITKKNVWKWTHECFMFFGASAMVLIGSIFFFDRREWNQQYIFSKAGK